MRTLGYRKKGINILYSMTALSGILVIFLGGILGIENNGHRYFMCLAGLLSFGVSLWILVGYYSTPKETIILLNEDEIQIGKEVRISIHSIVDVSYRRTSARGVQYRWGDVIISTNNSRYKVKYLADCEKVSKEITALMYKKKDFDN